MNIGKETIKKISKSQSKEKKNDDKKQAKDQQALNEIEDGKEIYHKQKQMTSQSKSNSSDTENSKSYQESIQENSELVQDTQKKEKASQSQNSSSEAQKSLKSNLQSIKEDNNESVQQPQKKEIANQSKTSSDESQKSTKSAKVIQYKLQYASYLKEQLNKKRKQSPFIIFPKKEKDNQNTAYDQIEIDQSEEPDIDELTKLKVENSCLMDTNMIQFQDQVIKRFSEMQSEMQQSISEMQNEISQMKQRITERDFFSYFKETFVPNSNTKVKDLRTQQQFEMIEQFVDQKFQINKVTWDTITKQQNSRNRLSHFSLEEILNNKDEAFSFHFINDTKEVLDGYQKIFGYLQTI